MKCSSLKYDLFMKVGHKTTVLLLKMVEQLLFVLCEGQKSFGHSIFWGWLGGMFVVFCCYCLGIEFKYCLIICFFCMSTFLQY